MGELFRLCPSNLFRRCLTHGEMIRSDWFVGGSVGLRVLIRKRGSVMRIIGTLMIDVRHVKDDSQVKSRLI
jgi:hypothetical protein